MTPVGSKTCVKINTTLTMGWLPIEMVSWLVRNVGNIYDSNTLPMSVAAYGWDAWASAYGNIDTEVTFGFDDPQKAMLFKLTWA